MKLTHLVPVAVGVLVFAGCSSDGAATTDSGSTSTLVSIATTTTPPTVPPTTTPVTTAAGVSTTTSTSTPPSSTSTSTTTTLPIGAELVLRANGLGSANFGTDPDGVVAYVAAIIGKPLTDSGWIDPSAVGACPGSELRQVTWGDLILQFSDVSNVTSGRRHFFSYAYGPSAVPGAPVSPAGLKTEAGIGVGSTVTELKGTYPTAVVNPADDFGGANYSINAGLAGFLSGVTDTDTVMSILGGQGCGE